MKKTIAQDFWSNVRVGQPDECWPWLRGIISTGYGVFQIKRRNIAAHRHAYALTYGAIPDGLFVCHSCDNRRCVNPSHLWLGTATDNNRDRNAKGRQNITTESAALKPAKTNPLEVIEMRRRHAGGESSKTLADCYGLSQRTVQAIIQRVNWKHI